MKKTIFSLSLLFCGLFAKAQIVNIPDANFKYALLNTPCVDTNGDNVGDADADTNNDGEIQVSEAAAVTWLNVNNFNIADLTGIQSFVNLQHLHCGGNQLLSLNVQDLTNLQNLNCEINQLLSLNVQGLTNLQYLNCNNNQLPSLDVQGLTNLQYLYCNNNQLPSLNVQGLTNLQELVCIYNQLPSLNVQGLTNLQFLSCSNNQLTSLNVQGLTNLEVLWCVINQLQSLNVQGLTNLQGLFCDNNQLPSLNVQGLTNLGTLGCGNNQLPSLNVQGLTNLQWLYCSSNPLSCLSFLPNSLTLLNTSNTNITCLPNIPAGIAAANTLPLCTPNNANGCLFVATETLAVAETSVSISPNPMHETTTISYQYLFSGVGNLKTTLTLYNTLGQVLKTQNFTSETLTLQRDELPAGCYFYSIRNGSELIGQGRLMME